MVKWIDSLPLNKKSLGGILALVVAACVGAFGAVSNPGPDDCEKAPLRHVYRPSRLKVVATCQRIDVVVKHVRKEHDGDYHVNVRAPDGWTDSANQRQGGWTVIEFVPGDPQPKKFFVGQRLEVLTTKVYDNQHKLKAEQNGWVEGHPVFEVKEK